MKTCYSELFTLLSFQASKKCLLWNLFLRIFEGGLGDKWWGTQKLFSRKIRTNNWAIWHVQKKNWQIGQQTQWVIEAPNRRIEKKLTPYLFSTKLTVTKINPVQTKITIDMLLRNCLSDEETQQQVLNWLPLRIRKDCINLEEVDYKMVSSCKSVSSFACKKEWYLSTY